MEELSGGAFDELAPALRIARAFRGRRQTVVAEQAGITKAMLCAYELGERRPSLATLEKIAAALEIDLGVLYRLMVVVRELRAGRFDGK
jgi:transcriptional regulator with XRE-family HTH domain